MTKRSAPTYPMSVTVIPTTRSNYENCAAIQASVTFTEGEAVFYFGPADMVDKDLAATVSKALSDR
jgi:hypothetical protein